MIKNRLLRLGSVAVVALIFFSGSAFAASTDPVASTLEGRITVSADIDDTSNFEGFEVLVIDRTQDGIDTLGHAETDRDGRFAMEITAPRRDVFPLVIRRYDQTLGIVDYVVADGESASFEVEMPGFRGISRIQSNENMAWMSYRNAKELHNQRMAESITEDISVTDRFESNIAQTTSVLWSLQNSFPGTLGADVAAAESIIMLSGWDDETVLERSAQITPQNPRYVDVARVARQASLNLHGHEEALRLLRNMKEGASAHQQAELQSQIVLAYAENQQQEAALEAANSLAVAYGHLEGWSAWAANISYELENLMPGMPAPDFSVTTVDGEEISLGELAGQVVLLEFYHPRDGMFARQIESRRPLGQLSQEDGFTILSLSLEPDAALNEAFQDGREIEGIHAILPDSFESELVRHYNVTNLPTRVLIDPDGNIRQKYVGGTLTALQEQAISLLQ